MGQSKSKSKTELANTTNVQNENAKGQAKLSLIDDSKKVSTHTSELLNFYDYTELFRTSKMETIISETESSIKPKPVILQRLKNWPSVNQTSQPLMP